MPKLVNKKRNGATQNSQYGHASTKPKTAHSIFKMNTEIGQHVLKNPGVAQAIVDKADLKQSDVSFYICYLIKPGTLLKIYRSYLKWAPGLEI